MPAMPCCPTALLHTSLSLAYTWVLMRFSLVGWSGFGVLVLWPFAVHHRWLNAKGLVVQWVTVALPTRALMGRWPHRFHRCNRRWSGCRLWACLRGLCALGHERLRE